MPRGTKRAAEKAPEAPPSASKKGKSAKSAPKKGKTEEEAHNGHHGEGHEAGPKGSICHFEIPVRDIAKAKKFYSTVFGWSFQTFAPTYEYVMYEGETKEKSSRLPHGGLILVDKAPPKAAGVIVHLTWPTIEDALKRVVAAGGKVVKPKFDIGGNIGFNAWFSDPDGNTIAVWAQK